MPFVFTNTLVIGLPTLQIMSPHQFRTLLARKIGQASLGQNKITGWLTGMFPVWHQYVGVTRNAGYMAMPLHWFFKAYIKMYQVFLLGVFRMDELEADIYALDLINDKDVLDVIAYEFVARKFLKKKFWPNLVKMNLRADKVDLLPYGNMTRIVRKGLSETYFNHTIDALEHQQEEYKSTDPGLLRRMENLGHQNLPKFHPVTENESAADTYLNNRLPMIVEKMDKKWLANIKKMRKH